MRSACRRVVNSVASLETGVSHSSRSAACRLWAHLARSQSVMRETSMRGVLLGVAQSLERGHDGNRARNMGMWMGQLDGNFHPRPCGDSGRGRVRRFLHTASSGRHAAGMSRSRQQRFGGFGGEGGME